MSLVSVTGTYITSIALSSIKAAKTSLINYSKTQLSLNNQTNHRIQSKENLMTYRHYQVLYFSYMYTNAI